MPRCKLDNCPVATDGRCLEGRGADCPNLIVETVTAESAAESSKVMQAEQSVTPETEPLPRGVPLEVAEARRVAQRGPCVVVVLAGMPECGKTSLLARLHQLFQAGSVGGFEFAGSQSLRHFEELNWLATVESGVAEPMMTRSSKQFDNCFLHLAVRSTDNFTRMELLINDITGETFENAVASQQTCNTLVALARADHLVVLVDGEALATPELRHHHIEQTCDFLQRVIQGGQCGAKTALHVVISKLDKLRDKETIAEKMEVDFGGQFHAAVGSLNFWRIAARPRDGSLPTKERIGELFAFWARTTHRYPIPILPIVGRYVWARDFCRYGI